MADNSFATGSYAATPLTHKERALYAAPPALTALWIAVVLQLRSNPESIWQQMSEWHRKLTLGLLVSFSLCAFVLVFFVYRIALKQVAAIFGAFGFDPIVSRRDFYLRHGPVLNGGRIVVIAGEQWMQFIHKTSMHLFNHEPGWPVTFKEILGYDALFLQEDGPKHDRVRRLIVKAFHGDYFRDYATRMAEIHYAWMEQMVERGELAGEDGFAIHDHVTTLVFRVVSALLIGGYDGRGEGDGAEHGERQRENDKLAAEYQVLNSGLLDFVGLAILKVFGSSCPLIRYTKFSAAMGARDRLLEHIIGVIETKRTRIEAGGSRGCLKDTLTLLCEDTVCDADSCLQAASEKKLPAKETNAAADGRLWTLSNRLLAEMSLQLMLGAHDTTSSFLVCFIVESLRHPQVLRELRREQDAEWGPFVPGEQHLVTAEFVQKRLPFMNMCITETERRYPPAPGNFRGANESFEHDGVKVQKGASIFYDAIATNHDPYVYGPDSLEWNPYRWTGKKLMGSSSRPFARVTFGAGPRNCLGQNFAKLNMKVFLTLLIRRFELTLVGPDSARYPILYAPSLKFRDGVRVSFKRRCEPKT